MNPEKRQALELWGRRVETLVGGEPVGTVGPFPGSHPGAAREAALYRRPGERDWT